MPRWKKVVAGFVAAGALLAGCTSNSSESDESIRSGVAEIENQFNGFPAPDCQGVSHEIQDGSMKLTPDFGNPGDFDERANIYIGYSWSNAGADYDEDHTTRLVDHSAGSITIPVDEVRMMQDATVDVRIAAFPEGYVLPASDESNQGEPFSSPMDRIVYDSLLEKAGIERAANFEESRIFGEVLTGQVATCAVWTNVNAPHGEGGGNHHDEAPQDPPGQEKVPYEGIITCEELRYGPTETGWREFHPVTHQEFPSGMPVSTIAVFRWEDEGDSQAWFAVTQGYGGAPPITMPEGLMDEFKDMAATSGENFEYGLGLHVAEAALEIGDSYGGVDEELIEEIIATGAAWPCADGRGQVGPNGVTSTFSVTQVHGPWD